MHRIAAFKEHRKRHWRHVVLPRVPHFVNAGRAPCTGRGGVPTARGGHLEAVITPAIDEDVHALVAKVDLCDHFAFATAASVPADIFPTNEALYIADQFGAECIREADEGKLSPATRKALTLRFARIAAKRAEKIIQFASNSTLGLPTILDTD